MIYLSDDYIEKYIDTFGYILSRAAFENYSFTHIEKTISYSNMASEFEQSNVTTIAFTMPQRIYIELFPLKANSGFVYNPYDEFSWAAYIYINIFLKYQLTFETIFLVLPIEKCLSCYKLYHEMDIARMFDLFEELMKPSILALYMRKKKLSCNDLANLSDQSPSTIAALKYNNRDINKLEAIKLLKITSALSIKMTSLLTSLDLKLH